MRLRTRIVITASLDAVELNCKFSRPDTTLSEVIETFDVVSSGTVELSASEANHVLPLGDIVNGRYLYIEADGDVTIKHDGEVTGHKLGAASTGTKAKVSMRTEFTSAPSLTNNSSTAVATVAYCLAGMKA